MPDEFSLNNNFDEKNFFTENQNLAENFVYEETKIFYDFNEDGVMEAVNVIEENQVDEKQLMIEKEKERIENLKNRQQKIKDSILLFKQDQELLIDLSLKRCKGVVWFITPNSLKDEFMISILNKSKKYKVTIYYYLLLFILF